MNERQKKKKKSTMRELAVGGGLMALFLPIILLALVWAIIALGFSLAYIMVFQSDLNAFGPVIAVYGGLLLIILFLAYKFSARFALLTQRLIGLMRERRRIRAETVPPDLSASSEYAEPQSLYEDDDTKSSLHSSR